MQIEEVIALLMAGGLGVLGKTAIDGLKARADSKRDDRRQEMDESKSHIDSSRTLVESAEKIVEMQNEQIDDLKRIIEDQQVAFQRRLDAQGAALAAYETRLDREMDARRRADVIAQDLREQLGRLRDELADMKATIKMADQSQQQLRTENSTLKQELFEMATGIAALTKQITDAGLEPVY